MNLESGEDLLHLNQLDQKLWTALSCPVNGLEIDKKTLELIDADKDGQIRVPEITGALKWITDVLKHPGDLLKQAPVFPLSAINQETNEGKILFDSARNILKNLGRENEDTLTVEDTSNTAKIFSASRFNGDGIITEDSAADPELAKLINEIMQCSSSVTDRSGKPGINQDILDSFFGNCTKFIAWNEKKESDTAHIFPFGATTEEAYLNFCALRPKINDFFIRCRLAAFDPQSTEILNLQVARVETITAKNLSDCEAEIAAYPLAKIVAGSALSVSTGINPAWETAVLTFKRLTVDPLFPDRESITELEWKKIAEVFNPYANWLSEKEGAGVEPLGVDRLKSILTGASKEQLTALIQEDNKVETEANNMILVDQLVRYHRDLFTLIKNFVTFFDFYSPGSKAIFQAGTLYIEQRSCDLCIKVQDMPKHSAIASFSGIYLIYCDCKSRATNEKMTILAAMTNGDIDNLVVGRNALFYDRNGLDWDATVVKIIDNPISIRQAFFSPYRKVSGFIEKQINKMAATQDEKVTGDMTGQVEKAPVKVADSKTKTDPPPPFDVGKFVGIFAAIGLAVGAIGTAIASVIAGFMKLEWWKMPFAMIGLLLVVSGPSMVIAYLKLRRRSLAPLLDANGWAINAKVIINVQFGNTLTHLAALPKGAKVNFHDPFSEKKRPILPAILILSLLAGILIYFLRKYGIIHIRF